MYHKKSRNWMYPQILLLAMSVPQMISTVNAAAEAPKEKRIYFNDAYKGNGFARIEVSHLSPEAVQQIQRGFNMSVCTQASITSFPNEPQTSIDVRLKQANQESISLNNLIRAMVLAGASYEEIKAITYLRLDALEEKDAALRASHNG